MVISAKREATEGRDLDLVMEMNGDVMTDHEMESTDIGTVIIEGLEVDRECEVRCVMGLGRGGIRAPSVEDSMTVDLDGKEISNMVAHIMTGGDIEVDHHTSREVQEMVEFRESTKIAGPENPR